MKGLIVSFNTQPPEGGCLQILDETFVRCVGFNTQPPEGGCLKRVYIKPPLDGFNTQPPEGGCPMITTYLLNVFSFNTQPPEGGCISLVVLIPLSPKVSTHSRPKAAAVAEETKTRIEKVSTHSRPKAAASDRIRRLAIACSFQHTAARRRLRTIKFNVYHNHLVSTHSRPKAAAPNTMNIELAIYSFNTQPPEGGCDKGYCFPFR